MKFLLVLAVSWTTFVLVTHGYPHDPDAQASKTSPSQQSSAATAYDDGDLATSGSEPQGDESVYNDGFHQDQAAFFPGFSPFETQPLGHSRPYLFQQEGAYSQRAVSPYQQQLSYDSYRGRGFGGSHTGSAAPAGGNSNYGILGSGNFGVIQGGTFYNDNDGGGTAATYQRPHYSSYYKNGHGRPSDYYDGLSNPLPQNHEQFANFRDFADINTPSYSEYVVVYANKNATASSGEKTEQEKEIDKKPKNIIEQLAMLDLMNDSEQETERPLEKPSKKLSKSKRKLALLMPEKKQKQKDAAKANSKLHDLQEPLLALS